MHRFKYYINKESLKDVATGRMHSVAFYARKPCKDALEVYLTIVNPIKDAKSKNKPLREKLGSNRKKRSDTQQTIQKMPRNRTSKR